MATLLYFNYDGQLYKFPIGTNIVTGKQIKKLIKTFLPQFTVYKSTRLWISGFNIRDCTMLVFRESGKVLVLTDDWLTTETEEGMPLPTINPLTLDDNIITID